MAELIALNINQFDRNHFNTANFASHPFKQTKSPHPRTFTVTHLEMDLIAGHTSPNYRPTYF